MQDVGLLAISILDECEAGTAIGIVFDRDHISDRVATAALEIDDTVILLVTAASMTGGLAAHVVAAAGALLALDEGLLGLALGDLLKRGERLEPLRGSQGAEGFECHGRGIG